MSYSFLTQLLQSGHLVLPTTEDYRVREQRSFERLQRLPVRTYLQEYDLLFRYVSLWLVEQGYELTNKQPHQILARVCEQFVPAGQVQEVIRCRHQLKYQGEEATSAGIAALTCLVTLLKEALVGSHTKKRISAHL